MACHSHGWAAARSEAAVKGVGNTPRSGRQTLDRQAEQRATFFLSHLPDREYPKQDILSKTRLPQADIGAQRSLRTDLVTCK